MLTRSRKETMSDAPGNPTQSNSDETSWSEGSLISAVLQSQKVIMRRIDSALRPIDMTFSRFEVLTLACSAADGIVATVHLCRVLQRHPTTIGSLVDRLERDGLVTRSVPRHDRRTTLVTVTASGREVWVNARSAIDGIASRVDLELIRRLENDMKQLIAVWEFGADDGQRVEATPEVRAGATEVVRINER